MSQVGKLKKGYRILFILYCISVLFLQSRSQKKLGEERIHERKRKDGHSLTEVTLRGEKP